MKPFPVNKLPAKERATRPDWCTQASSSSRSENCGCAGGVDGEKGNGGKGLVVEMGDAVVDGGGVGTMEEG